MNIIIRPEKEQDHEEVENLTREAFWDLYKPGCDEHLLAHKLRNVQAFLPELDFVAEADGQIVGNIMYSISEIIDENKHRHAVITFGPVGVLPSCQKAGIGSALIEYTVKKATELGYQAIIIFGNPAYYHRFGFVNAEKYHITTPEGKNFEAFMVLELYKGALQGITGKYYEDPVFHIEPEELEAFEKKFPYKEKHITDTQFR